MKIQLMSASKRRKMGRVQSTKKEQSMATVVQKFINGPLKTAIENTDSYGINEQIPHEAYSDLPLFFKLCSEALTPLGYECGESHDGAGMYNTLYVNWQTHKVDKKYRE